MQRVNIKCQECAKLVFRNKKDIKPQCYIREVCSKKRCYYRNIEHYRAKLRQYHRYLKFLGDKCIVCGSVEGLEAHHIQAQVLGGLDKEMNILTLCHTCHRVITIYTRRLGLERPLIV